MVSYKCGLLSVSLLICASQLHRNQEHPDEPMLEHIKELIAKLDSLGISASPLEDVPDEEGDEEDWESDDGSVDHDGDVDMK